mmetsp:Transcript_30649/g.73441  ORF Transcript_30649/g.73441 Transcript_30649/m.73441 type:complete len:301 (+) Transcript_30649:65-967(+)
MRAICAIAVHCVISVQSPETAADAGLLRRGSELVQAALSKQYSPEFLRRASELENLPEEYEAEVDDTTSEDSSIEDVVSGHLGSGHGKVASLFRILIPSDVVLPDTDTFLPRRTSAEQNFGEAKAAGAPETTAAETQRASVDSVPIDMDDEEVGSQVDQALQDAYNRADHESAVPENLGKVERSLQGGGSADAVPPSAVTAAIGGRRAGGAPVSARLPSRSPAVARSVSTTLRPSPQSSVAKPGVDSAPRTVSAVRREFPSPEDDDSDAEEPPQLPGSAQEAENVSQMIREQATSEMDMA